MIGKDKNRPAHADRVRKVKAGLAKYHANETLSLAGTSFTPADLQAFLQSDVDANDATTAARDAWLKAVSDARALGARVGTVLSAIESRAKADHGQDQNAGDVLSAGREARGFFFWVSPDRAGRCLRLVTQHRAPSADMGS